MIQKESITKYCNKNQKTVGYTHLPMFLQIHSLAQTEQEAKRVIPITLAN